MVGDTSRCGVSGKGTRTNLHTTTKAENKVKGGFLLNIVIRKGSAVLKLLSSENQALLVGGDALLVLDLRLDIVDGIRGLDLEGDGLAGDYLINVLAYLMDLERCHGSTRCHRRGGDDGSVGVTRGELTGLDENLHDGRIQGRSTVGLWMEKIVLKAFVVRRWKGNEFPERICVRR